MKVNIVTETEDLDVYLPAEVVAPNCEVTPEVASTFYREAEAG